jgi:hypothetical protein
VLRDADAAARIVVGGTAGGTPSLLVGDVKPQGGLEGRWLARLSGSVERCAGVGVVKGSYYFVVVTADRVVRLVDEEGRCSWRGTLAPGATERKRRFRVFALSGGPTGDGELMVHVATTDRWSRLLIFTLCAEAGR